MRSNSSYSEANIFKSISQKANNEENISPCCCEYLKVVSFFEMYTLAFLHHIN